MALLDRLCRWRLCDRMVPMNPNLRSALATTAICVWILAGVFVSYAALLSCGDSLQPDANQVEIGELQKDVQALRTAISDNRNDAVAIVQKQLQLKGYRLMVVDSTGKPMFLFRKW